MVVEKEEHFLELLNNAFEWAYKFTKHDDGWSKFQSKVPHVTEFQRDGDAVKECPFKGGSLPQIKARGVVRSTKSARDMVQWLLDADYDAWEADEDLLEMEVLKKVKAGPHECRVVYKKFASPRPVSDREFVSVVSHKEMGNGAHLFVDRSVNYPKQVSGGCVRGQVVLSAALVEPTNKPELMMVTFLSWLDMKGMLPATMISLYRTKTAERIDLYRFVFSGQQLEGGSEEEESD